MNINDMIEFWRERIPQTEAAAAAAADNEDWQAAETLHMLTQQQIAFLEDLEGLRLFWLTKAAEQPSRAEVIRTFCGMSNDVFGETAVVWAAE